MILVVESVALLAALTTVLGSDNEKIFETMTILFTETSATNKNSLGPKYTLSFTGTGVFQ